MRDLKPNARTSSSRRAQREKPQRSSSAGQTQAYGRARPHEHLYYSEFIVRDPDGFWVTFGEWSATAQR